MNIEQTGAGTSSTESTERKDFATADARLDEIKAMNMGDMSDDDLENVMAERKALRAQKEEMMGSAQEQATAEDKERGEAEMQKAEQEKQATEVAEAEKAKQIEERKQAEAVQIEALTAEIKGESAIANQTNTADLVDELNRVMDGNRTNYATNREASSRVYNNQLGKLKSDEPDIFGKSEYHTAESVMIDDARREDYRRTSGNYHPSGGEEAIAELKSKLEREESKEKR